MDSDKPGNSQLPDLSPSQLGLDRQLGNLFGGNKPEVRAVQGRAAALDR